MTEEIEQAVEATPEEQLLAAAKAILSYPNMIEFIETGDMTAAYGIMMPHLAALRTAVDAVEV